MKGVGGSAERLHSGPGGPSGPNQWEMVAMDYVDLNDLVPQVFFCVQCSQYNMIIILHGGITFKFQSCI